MTHVSYNGYLQKVISYQIKVPANALFVACGRLVNPKGFYNNAPYVRLYQTSDGFVAVQ